MTRPLMVLLFVAACRTKDLPDTGVTPNESVPVGTDSAGFVDQDGDGVSSETDCDDTDSTVYPGATEVCDGVDDDCDGSVDEEASDASTWYTDADGDGYGDSGLATVSCEPPEGSVTQSGDCDDSDPSYNPGATEGDCQDPNDYNCDGSVGYADNDDDGYPACDDCDDSNNQANPGGSEVCDGADNNCDGSVDEGVTSTYYRDQDADGFGDPDYSSASCEQPSGYVEDSSDCEDTLSAVNPDATEICDLQDNDCDSLIDEDDAADAATWYADTDGDGYGDPGSSQTACSQPSGAVADSTDCDDSDSAVNTGATEICDSIDNDCDGSTDEPDAADASTWYTDSDNDGFGDPSTAQLACEQPSGAVADDQDCDDSARAINPDATEICDSQDNDCDGTIDEPDASDALTWYADADGDGYGDPSSSVLACSQPSGYGTDTQDCDDSDASISPDGLEICDGADNNCDGSTDGSDSWWDSSWAYRIPLTITASTYSTEGPPLSVAVDFGAALDSVGDSGTFNPDSMRVVVQDCALGQPELPSQFEDSLSGLFAKSSHSDSTGDEQGDVYFVWDEDGDLTSLETLSASSSVNAAIYFGTSGTAPSYTTSLSATTTALSNSVSSSTYTASAGGLLATLKLGSSTSVMSQTGSCCGNGAYVASSWSYTPMYTTGTTTVLADGPVMALIQSTGTLSGLYTYTYWYWMFEGRPELWSKTTQTTVASTSFNHSGHWTGGVRPWESVQTNISGTATFTTDSSTYLWADATNSSVGVSFGYAKPPTYITAVMSNYNPYIITYGNDVGSSSTSSSMTMASGTKFLDSVVMVVMPHTGTFASVKDDFLALLAGASVSAGSAEAW